LLVHVFFATTLFLTVVPSLAAQPQIDYHQHLFSARVAKFAPGLNAFSASDLITLLDKAGIRRAVVLSVAYQFSNPNKPPVKDEYADLERKTTGPANRWRFIQSACGVFAA